MHPKVAEILSVYTECGDADYIGEPVSQLAHMLQAAYFAQESGADSELILAAFFHDVGHLCADKDAQQMSGLGVLNHEHVGAQFVLERGCSKRVAELVAGHVQAKRYLCWSKPSYLNTLSQASRQTLDFQGGPMNEREARIFEESPYFKDILRLRVWDERAKVPNGPKMTLGLMSRLLEQHIALEEQDAT